MGNILLKGKHEHGLYSLLPLVFSSPAAFMGIRITLDGWHSRLGHPSLRIVRQVVSKNNLAVLQSSPVSICHACQLGKSHRLPIYLHLFLLLHYNLFFQMYGVLPLFSQ